MPVVAADVGANREIVEDGVTGYLVKSEDEWVDRLRALLDSPALRRSMGRAGRERVVARYSVDVVAPLIVQALQDAAGA
jgi:glycosyltransferase involved in cell wall biosynthesis